MGIEDIQKEVLQAAEYDAAQLKKDAEKQARGIIGEAKDKAEAMRKGFREELKRAAEREHRKAIEAAHFEAASSVLRLKKELMDGVIAEAKALTRDLGGRAGTGEMGDAVAAAAAGDIPEQHKEKR